MYVCIFYLQVEYNALSYNSDVIGTYWGEMTIMEIQAYNAYTRVQENKTN